MNLTAIQAAVSSGVLSQYDQAILDGLAGIHYLTPRQNRTAWCILKRYPQLNSIAPSPAPNADAGAKVVYLGEKDSLAFLFPFDPEIAVRLQALPAREYVKKPRPHWLIPCTPTAALPALELAAKYRFDFTDDALERIANLPTARAAYRANVVASSAKEAEIALPRLGGELRPFQGAAVAYALKNPKCIIADQMGLGKTVEVLATLEAANTYPALVVCPASVKGVWANHVREWLPHRYGYILGDKAIPPVAHVSIVNYEQLAKWKKLLKVNWAAIIFDEAHYIKEPTAARSKLAAEIAQGCPRILMLSGTPVLNRPIELAHPLNILGALPKFGGFWPFVKRYCAAQQKRVYTRRGEKLVWDFSGHDHTAELHERLAGEGLYLRRLKSDVLSELPPKQRAVVPLPIANRAEYRLAEQEVRRQLQVNANRAVTLTRFEALKQVAARGKLAGAIEWITDFLETGEKLVVFAIHREIVGAIAEHFHAPMIRGDTPLGEREEAVWRFQNDPAVSLIACNLQAGGVGLTLTAASNVAFLELPWNAATLVQGEDRCHRLGQTDSVTSYLLLDDDTIDGEVWEIIKAKWGVVDSVTDGAAETNGDELVNEIIGQIIDKYSTKELK